MRERTLFGSAAGFFFGGGVALCREGIVWAYGKGLDWLSGSIGAAQVTWFEALPWWNITGGCSMAVGVALTAYAAFRSPSPALVSAAAPSLPAAQSSPSVATPASIPRKYLESSAVFEGFNSDLPVFRAIFARNGRSARFYFEVSLHHPGFGSGWTQPRKFLVAERDRFAEGEVVTFKMIGRCETSGGTRWYFGPEPKLQNGYPENMLNDHSHWRGRVTFLADDDTNEYCYFIVSARAYDDMPDVVGQHIFDHMFEWEAKPAPNGDTASLYR